MHLDFWFDPLDPTLKRKGDGGIKSFSVLIISRSTSPVSLLVWHFQWKCSISAGQNARMFYLMEFPTQEWNNPLYCHGCLSS